MDLVLRERKLTVCARSREEGGKNNSGLPAGSACGSREIILYVNEIVSFWLYLDLWELVRKLFKYSLPPP